MPIMPGMNAGNPMSLIQNLLQMLTGKGGSRPMDEKLPGGIDPAHPDPATVLGPLTQQSTAIPGAGIPQPQKQYAQTGTPSAYREFQTSGGHKRAAMGDIFGNVREIMQTHEKNKDAQEARNLSVDLERLMTAAANPQDPQNQQIIVDLLSDPKKAKRIQKALDINFMGPDKRDPVSKQAMDSALNKLKASMGTPQFGQQLGKTLGAPNVTTMSPEMQIRAALTKAKVLPSADVVLQQATKEKVDFNNAASRERIAKAIVDAKNKETAQKYISSLDRIDQAKVMADARKYAADKAFSAAKYRVDNDPRLTGGYDKSVKSLKSEYDALVKKHDSLLKEWINSQKPDSNLDTQAIGKELHDNLRQQKQIMNKLHKLNMNLGKGPETSLDSGATNDDDTGTTRPSDTSSDNDNFDAGKLFDEVTGGDE